MSDIEAQSLGSSLHSQDLQFALQNIKHISPYTFVFVSRMYWSIGLVNIYILQLRVFNVNLISVLAFQ